MYQQDSFFTLGNAGQAGLALLSLGLALLFIGAVLYLGRGFKRVARILFALLLFWAFCWLSPQIYYTYYMLIFDGLPLQIVIGTAPSPLETLRILFFLDSATLSAHGQAVMGWVGILAAIVGMPQRSELTAP